MNKTWTILGAGDFIGEMIDNIEANKDKCLYIVVNNKLDKGILKIVPKGIKVVNIKQFKPSTHNYIYGHHSYGIGQTICPVCTKKNLGIFHKLNFSNLIHPTAYISKSSKMGIGNYFGPGSIIGAKTVIGNFNTFNRASTCGHDDNIGDHNNFGPAATVCGFCSIGSENYLAVRATVVDKITIASNIVVGAGAVVLSNLIKRGTYIGIPAKKLIRKPFLRFLSKFI